jgi:carboxypeptidase family protein/TonB-dependent receptor-like protein
MHTARFAVAIFCLVELTAIQATIFGTVRGIVHDSQHLPIPGATITLKAQDSDWIQMAQTNESGEFEFTAVPIGNYTVIVTLEGFQKQEQDLTVRSDSSPVFHFELALASLSQRAVVKGEAVVEGAGNITPTTTLSRQDIQDTPGADRTNSMSMITDNVPGAYMVHDQLHIRGGHQVSWLIDGVPVPNTNIASNVGPQFDPKDIDYIEVQRGSYDADYGDRTYGVLNVVPRTGFELDRECDVVFSYGNYHQTNDQVNCGAHTQRLAYYGSVNGNRSDLGLETPVADVIHDSENGFGGFGSLIYNVNPSNQLRLVTSLRRDFYQIPNTPDQESAGIRDVEREADAFVNFSWVRTFTPKVLLTVSPFYHFNKAGYDGGPNDFPISTIDDRSSNYAGGQATVSATLARNTLRAGLYGFWQHDDQLFALIFNAFSSPGFQDRELAAGNSEALFVEDRLSLTSWLSVSGGIRGTHFSTAITEDVASPRAGVAVRVPHINWVLSGFYGQFYQPPPLITASGPLLDFVTSQSLGFIPLLGERDTEYQFGLTIPYKSWSLDVDNFKTRAHNFFDHNSVGNSNIFFPLTIDQALIRGWELTLRSPRLWRTAQVHLSYSNQVALARGAITGGLTDFSPPQDYFALDHDQRNTLNVGFDANFPWRTFIAGNIYYGSGFTNGTPPPDYLPGHTTLDLSVGKAFGERFSASLNALNVANSHLLIDNSFTFGGMHFNNPREVYAELRYRFHY